MPTIAGPKEQSVLPDGSLSYQSAGGASPDAFGASVGAAFQQAGQSADNIALRNIGIKNEADHVDALNQLMLSTQDLQNGNKQTGEVGFRNLAGQNAVDALPDYQAKVQDAYKDIRQGLNPAVARMFDQSALRIVRGTTDSMGAFSSQQQAVGLHQSQRANVDLARNGALTYADDPDGLALHLGALQAASLASSRTLGLPAEATNMQYQRDMSQFYVERTQQLVNRDPIEAAKFYHDNIGMVVPDQRYELEKMLKTTTDAQYAHSDGQDAYHAVIGQTSAPPTAKTVPGSDLAPYADKDVKRVADFVKAPSQYDPIIDNAAKTFGVSPTEIKLKIGIESGGNPNAVNPQSGATGLGQFMPATAAQYGITDRTDPTQSINGIAKFLAAHGGGVGGDPAKADKAYMGSGPTADQYVENTRVARQAITGGGAPAPLTAAQLEGRESDVISSAEAAAAARRPGDSAYADQVVSHARSYWARDVQALRGQDYQNFTSVLGATVQSGATSTSDLSPDVQATLSKLSPQNLAGINAQFDRNMRQANGEFTHSDPKLVNDLTQRVYLADGDPQKITNPGQLSEFMGKGLNYSDMSRLSKEIQDANSPEGSPFMKQANQVKSTARKMLTSSMNQFALAHPPLAEEASYRFGLDLDDKIKAARAAKVDPQTLFTPGNPNYVLDPSRVAGFMPTESQMAAARAHALATPATQVPKVANDADYNALPPGTSFMAPDGSRRQKPGAAQFATEADAEAAGKAGTIKPGARIKVGNQMGTWNPSAPPSTPAASSATDDDEDTSINRMYFGLFPAHVKPAH